MKKLRLKNLLSCVVLFLTTLSFVSCSNEIADEVTPNSLNDVKSDLKTGNASREGNIIDTAFVVESTKAATIDFTNEIRAFYIDGMSYSDLKSELDPAGNLSNITTVGDALLYEAYSNIVNNVSENDMNGLKMTQALQYIIEEHIKDGFTKTEDVNFESGSKELFGLDENYETTARAGGCKWYQVGCLLNAFWNWLAADANGAEPGTTTNGQNLASLVSALGGLVGLGISLFGGN